VDNGDALQWCHNLAAEVLPDPDSIQDYTFDDAMVIAQLMHEIRDDVIEQEHDASFAQQYFLHKGLAKFQEKGKQAATKELGQMHNRVCFTPVSISSLSPTERKRAQEALMFLTEKKDGTVKSRLVYNGAPTREWVSREEASSPTAALKSLVITATIDAHEGRDVMSGDVPNAFIQARMPVPQADDDIVYMKITGVLVQMLVDIDPELYGPFVVYENGRKVLYVMVLKAIYGMLVASLLWYKKFRKDLEDIDFVFNPYDPCVANRIVYGTQHTLRFHVDDILSSHARAKVNTNFANWLNKKYGKHGEVKICRGKKHEYLGMILNFKDDGGLEIDMQDYVKKMVDAFPINIDPQEEMPISPAAEGLLDAGKSRPLNHKQAEVYHTFVAKGLFVSKRARPDIHPTIAVLCTRTGGPNQSDWHKLVRLIKYLHGTCELVLKL